VTDDVVRNKAAAIERGLSRGREELRADPARLDDQTVDEAIVLNQDGHISEGSAANFMMIRDGVLITPPITANVLEGITRRTILHLAQEALGLEVVERNIDRTELYIAEEAFFCGTGVQIAAIGSIDHRSVGNGGTGPLTQQLREAYFDVVMGRNPTYRHWLTPVPVLEAVEF